MVNVTEVVFGKKFFYRVENFFFAVKIFFRVVKIFFHAVKIFFRAVKIFFRREKIFFLSRPRAKFFFDRQWTSSGIRVVGGRSSPTYDGSYVPPVLR